MGQMRPYASIRAENDTLEWFFSEDREEPVIVKNLENIQGDERDVMVFSTTFGRDTAGKLSMNFGPMNQDGGQKRLNVAVTRSRREMHVFSSIEAADIDVTRTKAQGVRDLRAFLDYAARGSDALVGAATGSTGGVDSPFEADVKTALEALGWEARTQIGVSGYRIDLGVVHPDHAGRYLAGVECDGASYHASPTARDRDRMREAVLRGLGWEIERVWSTEWFAHRDRVLGELDARLRELLAVGRETDTDGDDIEPSGDVPDVVSNDHNRTARGASSAATPENAVGASGELETATVYAANSAVISTASEKKSDAHPAAAATSSRADIFFDDTYTKELSHLIAGIVKAHGPVHLNAVGRAITAAHGWSRVGGRIRARIEACSAGFARTDEPNGVILWPSEPEPIVAWRGLAGRDPGEIPIAEIAGLLDRHPELVDKQDPVLALARQLDLSRLTASRRGELEAMLVAARERLNLRSSQD